MKVLILGGTGMIGAAFTRELLVRGHQVWVASRSPEKAVVPAGAQLIRWDARSAEGWGPLLAQMDAVANLAGENIGGGLWTEKRKQRIRSSRLQAGQAVVEAFRSVSVRPQLLLQASAVGYYGVHNPLSLGEDAPAGVDDLSKLCVEWENATLPVEELGVRRVVIRTGIVLEAQHGILPRFLLPFRLFVGGPMGAGRQVISWIHLQDQIDAMIFLLENTQSQGVYNLTAPEPQTNAEFGRALAKVTRRPYWLPVPAFALRLVLGEMSTLVLDGQRVLPERLLREGFRFRFPKLEGALQDLLPLSRSS